MAVLLAMAVSDTIDEATAVRGAWHSLHGNIPNVVNAIIEQDRFLEAAIELARAILGDANFLGWRASFTSAGGPYTVTLFLGEAFSTQTLEGRSNTALSAAFINAVASSQGVRSYRR